MGSLFRVLRFLGFLIGLFFFALPAFAKDPNADIYGEWKLVELTGGADIISVSDKQARALVGRKLFISPERFEFNGKKCMYPEYKRSTDETVSHFRREWAADSSDLRLPNPVTLVDNGCYTLYLQREGHLIVAVDSVFYEAVRVRKLGRK
jgi:hypothetical protein